MTNYFDGIDPIRFDPSSESDLAFRHYDPDEVVAGKRMEDHLRFAVAYWHSFAWEGGDPFGGRTFDRPWWGDDMAAARAKADAAFQMFSILGQPYFCFHDLDVRPEGATFAESQANLEEIVEDTTKSTQDWATDLEETLTDELDENLRSHRPRLLL